MDLYPPVHIGIIMDGNGRWASTNGLPRVAGHCKGVESVRCVIIAARKLGVRYITLFGFSSENWTRHNQEVSNLMNLLRFYLRSEIEELNKQGVRLRGIGERSRLPADIVQMIESAEAITAANSALTLILALSYGSRQEIVQTIQKLAEQVAKGDLSADDIDEDMFSANLVTAGIPYPDLVIRTGGERRLSNFLLWQSADAELVFTDTFWPNFTQRDLEYAIDEFHRRGRRHDL